jgi:hypothetical protein
MRERRSDRTNSGLENPVANSPASRRVFTYRKTAATNDQFDRQSKKLPRRIAGYNHADFLEYSAPRKRRRTPSCEIVESEDELGPSRSSSSAIAHQERAFFKVTHASRRKTLAQWEEDDRRLAERLAAEEEDDLLMLMEGQWTKARPGSKGRPINLDDGARRFEPRGPFQDSSFDVHGNSKSFSKSSTRRQSETFDAAIARQIEKEEAEAQEARLREASSRTRDCAVCGDATLVVELPSLFSCTHNAEVCADCYTAWFGSQLEQNGWQEVKCPGQSCKVNLTCQEIKAYASKEVFERYDVIQARNVLSADPNFRWCKTQGCGSGQIHDVEEVGNEFVCVECHERSCTVHEGLYHDDETCEEYEYRTSGQKERDERRKEDEASEEAVGKLTKRCPGSECGRPIEKNGGCNHMSCKSMKRSAGVVKTNKMQASSASMNSAGYAQSHGILAGIEVVRRRVRLVREQSRLW